MLTLWDLVEPVVKAFRGGGAKPDPALRPKATLAPASRHKVVAVSPVRAKVPGGVQAKYDAITRELLATHNIRVRKWRKSSSGVAVLLQYKDGSVRKYIECPRPRGPMSMAIFLHEIGHHVLGVGSISPRCLEEYKAWEFALAEMERRGLNITESVRKRVDRSLKYAVGKASRRGIRELPEELRAYAA